MVPYSDDLILLPLPKVTRVFRHLLREILDGYFPSKYLP
jgi:hypothetical protein